MPLFLLQHRTRKLSDLWTLMGYAILIMITYISQCSLLKFSSEFQFVSFVSFQRVNVFFVTHRKPLNSSWKHYSLYEVCSVYWILGKWNWYKYCLKITSIPIFIPRENGNRTYSSFTLWLPYKAKCSLNSKDQKLRI